MQKMVFLTGATGFVGGGVLRRLLNDQKYPVVTAIRLKTQNLAPDVLTVHFESLDATTPWANCFTNVGTVIHAAARVHIMDDSLADPLSEYRKVNVEGTLNLARKAADAGVERFIFISSIKVNGEGTSLGSAYTPDDIPSPVDPYGISKLEAERGLHQVAAETGMEIVVIRPVLVYGPGVKANFLDMMRWLNKGIPLPFGAIHNRRSLVALDNLVDLVVTCIDHPAAANETFLVSDGVDMSTTQLLESMAKALDKSANLLPVPSWILQAGAKILGKKALSQRLCGSLQVDISKTKSLLGWTPPVRVDKALLLTAEYFLDHQ